MYYNFRLSCELIGAQSPLVLSVNTLRVVPKPKPTRKLSGLKLLLLRSSSKSPVARFVSELQMKESISTRDTVVLILMENVYNCFNFYSIDIKNIQLCRENSPIPSTTRKEKKQHSSTKKTASMTSVIVPNCQLIPTC